MALCTTTCFLSIHSQGSSQTPEYCFIPTGPTLTNITTNINITHHGFKQSLFKLGGVSSPYMLKSKQTPGAVSVIEKISGAKRQWAKCSSTCFCEAASSTCNFPRLLERSEVEPHIADVDTVFININIMHINIHYMYMHIYCTFKET